MCSSAAGTRSRTRRGCGPIADALAAAGASDAVLAFEEQGVMGATKARANRLANADHANLVRTSRAAQAQIRAVKRLERRGALAKLPPKLREIARLRLRHPSLSLRELASNAVRRRRNLRRNGASQALSGWPGCRARHECAILDSRRVCARPAADSDPVRRQGPERGSTGGGGRPRIPSGPPHHTRRTTSICCHWLRPLRLAPHGRARRPCRRRKTPSRPAGHSDGSVCGPCPAVSDALWPQAATTPPA